MARWTRLLLLAGAGAAVAGVLAVAIANVVVVQRTDQHVVVEPEALQPAQVAIVPGSLVRGDGSLGDVVAERVEAAVALYDAGRVDALLVSGDNGTPEYNEPDAMRDAALAAGVPPQDVFTDYAGFSTWATMRRAREIFEVSSAVVVTQDAYAARSVDLARAAGIEAQALESGPATGGPRELLARVRGLAQATWRPDVTGGDTLPITGDGRRSWADSPA